MGRLAQLVGVGVKGNLNFMLASPVAVAGDVVQGIIYLHLTEELHAKDIVVRMRGVEELFGVTGGQGRRIYHSRECVFYEQLVPVMATAALLSSGIYEFRFGLPLPRELPGSFQISGYTIGGIGVLSDVSASVRYKLSVKLRAKGAFVADLRFDTELYVQPSPPILQLRAATVSTSKRAYQLGVIPRGKCHLSVSIDRDVLVAGSPLYVSYSVSNGSRMAVSSVAVRLVEDISVRPTMLPFITKSSSSSVCSLSLGGLVSGERRDDVVRLDLVYDSTGEPLRRTTKARYTKWRYYLEVRCHFALSPSVGVDLPIVVV